MKKHIFTYNELNKLRDTKILDESGNPLLVYHGCKKKFNSFDKTYQKNGWLGKGFYFTSDKNSASTFGKYIIKAYLCINNPFIVKGNNTNDIYYEIRDMYDIMLLNTNIDISDFLKEKGYDGVIFNHWDLGNMYTCFNSEQIIII